MRTLQEIKADVKSCLEDHMMGDIGCTLFPCYEVDLLIQESKRLRDALSDLMDEQNGPPLIRNQASWEAAMSKAREALKEG